MSLDITTLSVKVEGKGIDATANSLDNLTKKAEAAEASVGKLQERMKQSQSAADVVKNSMSQMRDILAKSFPLDGATALNKALAELASSMNKIKGKNITVDFGSVGKDAEVARKGVASLNQSLMEGHNVFQIVGKSLYQLRNLLGGTMLAASMVEATKSAVTMADAWTLMQSKLKMQLAVGADVHKVQMDLVNSALSMKIPLESMVTLYSRLVPAMKDYGIKAESAMKVTETMAAALKASGATGAETASVMLQFSQSMAAGRLNGAEFNAVAEGAPVILRLLAKELNVTRGELKKMAADGMLSTDILTIVLEKYHDQLTAQAKSVPDTVGSSFEYLKTQFTVYVGQANEAVGVTGVISSAIKGLADNLTLLGDIIKYSVVAGLALYVGSLVKSTATSIIANAAAKELVVSMGLTGVAASGAATGVGLLDKALLFLAKNPIIVALAIIAAGALYLYEKMSETAKAAGAFDDAMSKANGAIDATDKMNAYSEAVKIAQTEMGKADLALENLLAARKNSTNAIEIARLNAEIETQREKLSKVTKEWHKAKEAKDNYASVVSAEDIHKQTSEIEKQIELLRAQNAAGETWTKTQKDIYQKQKDIKALKEKEGGADPRILAEQEKQLGFLKDLNKEEQIQANLKKANKKAERAEESTEKKYIAQLNSANAFIEKLEEEANIRRKLTDAEKEALKIQAFLDANKAKGGAVNELVKQKERILQLGKEQLENTRALENEQISFNNLMADKKAAEELRIASAALQDQIELQRLSNSESYKSVLASELRKQALEKEANAALISINDQLIARKKLVASDPRLSEDERRRQASAIDTEIRGNAAKIAQYNALISQVQEYNAELYKASQITVLSIGRTPGDILAEGFGNAGKAISNMITAYEDFGKQSKAINAELAGQQEMLRKQGLGKDSKEWVKAEEIAADKRIQINAQMFGSMAGAAKGFFGEQTKAYKILATAEKAFRAIELAMAIKNYLAKMTMTTTETAAVVAGEATKTAAEEAGTVTSIASSMARGSAKALEAVASAFAAPFPLNFAAGAAMIAIMAGLGFAIKGGKGSAAPSSGERQASQGSGSVLGDSGAKSESVTKALNTLVDNSKTSLKYNEGMLTSLKNIESALVGVTKLVVRSGVQGKLGSAEGMGTTNSSTFNKMFNLGELGSMSSLIFAPLKAIGNALFSVKKSVVDSGFIQNAQSFADILSKGLNVMGYTDIETKSKKWGKTKTSTETNLSELSDELQTQLSNIVLGMGKSIQESAKILGANGDDFANTLNSFSVDIGRISLQGMDAKQIQETLTNVFSKLGDEMVAATLPAMKDFQNVGEGLLETLVRVSSTVATVDGIFNSIGQTFGQVGLDGAKAKIDLVELAGGIQELSNKVGNFFDKFYTDAEKQANTTRLITEEFKRLGIQMIDLSSKNARIDFRNLVNQYKDVDAVIYNSLLNLVDAVDSVAPAFDEATSAIDKAAYALEKLKSAADNSLSALENSINAEKTALKKSMDDKIKELNSQKDIENASYESAKKSLEEQASLQSKAYDNQISIYNSQLDAAKNVSSKISTLFEDITSALDTLTGSQSTLSAQAYQSAKQQLDSSLMLAKATGLLPDPASFKGVLDAVSNIDASKFASLFDYQREQLQTAGKLSQLRDVAGSKLTQQNATVAAIEASIVSIESVKVSAEAASKAALDDLDKKHKETISKIDDQIKAVQDQYEADVFYLDGLLQTAKDQLAKAEGTYTAILSVTEALNVFNTNLMAYIDAKMSSADQVNTASDKVTISSVNDSTSTAVGDVAAELKQLREDLASQNRAIAQNTLATAKILSAWDGDGQPEQRVVA